MKGNYFIFIIVSSLLSSCSVNSELHKQSEENAFLPIEYQSYSVLNYLDSGYYILSVVTLVSNTSDSKVFYPQKKLQNINGYDSITNLFFSMSKNFYYRLQRENFLEVPSIFSNSEGWDKLIEIQPGETISIESHFYYKKLDSKIRKASFILKDYIFLYNDSNITKMLADDRFIFTDSDSNILYLNKKFTFKLSRE